jgi:hypothetical protein
MKDQTQYGRHLKLINQIRKEFLTAYFWIDTLTIMALYDEVHRAAQVYVHGRHIPAAVRHITENPRICDGK